MTVAPTVPTSIPNPLDRIQPVFVPLSGVGPHAGGLNRLLAKAARTSGKRNLTKKEQLFISCFIKHGCEGVPAMREAFPKFSGDSGKEIADRARFLLAKTNVREEIEFRLSLLKRGALADRQEIQEGLTEDFRNPESWQHRHSAATMINRMDGNEAPIHHIHDHTIRDAPADLSELTPERRKALIGRHGTHTLEAHAVKMEVQLLEEADDEESGFGERRSGVSVPPVQKVDGDSPV